METITSIEEVSGYEYTHGWKRTWDGYRVVTSEREILLLVSDSESCCESWGMVSSEDDTSEFVGAELRGVDVVDENRCKSTFGLDESVSDGSVMFVDLRTDRGVLQLAVYNCHNGFYGHDALLVIGGKAVAEDTL